MKVTILCLVGSVLCAASAPAAPSAPISVFESVIAFDVQNSCSISSVARDACTAATNIEAGLAYNTTCVDALSDSSGVKGLGLCNIDDGAGKVASMEGRVDSQGCSSFTFAVAGGDAIFSDVVGAAPIVSARIVASAYAHSNNGDEWTVDPGDPSNGSGSTITLTRGGRNETLYIKGSIVASSNCGAGISASGFSATVSMV